MVYTNKSYTDFLKEAEKKLGHKIKKPTEVQTKYGQGVGVSTLYPKASDVPTKKELYQSLGFTDGKTINDKWETDLLSHLSKKKYGSTYDAKLNKIFGSQWTAKDFQRFMDNRTNNRIIQETTANKAMNNWEAERAKSLKEQEKQQQALAQKKAQQQPSSNKKNHQNTFLEDLLNPAKRVVQALNPFDNVSVSQALQGNYNDTKNTKRSGVTKETTRALTRALNTQTFGAVNELTKHVNNGQPYKEFQDRKGGGKVADTAYDLIGGASTFIPGAKLLGPAGNTVSRTLLKGKAGQAIEALAASRGIDAATALRSMTQNGLAMGVYGTINQGLGEALNPNEANFQQRATQVGADAVGGAFLGPALESLVHTQLGQRIIGKIRSGKPIEQVAHEEGLHPQQVADLYDYSGRTFQREASGTVMDPNAPRLNAPEQPNTLGINGPVQTPPSEPLGLNEPLYRPKNKPKVQQLNTPPIGRPIQSEQELNDVMGMIDQLTQKHHVNEQSFVDSQLAPFRETAQQQAAAQAHYENVVKTARTEAEKIKGNFGKIYVPKGERADYNIPPQFRASLNDKHSSDIHSFATEYGFSSPDEAVQYLQSIDQASKTKLKDMMPGDNYKISEDQWTALENAAKKSYRATQEGKATDDLLTQLINDVTDYTKSRPKLNVKTPDISSEADSMAKLLDHPHQQEITDLQNKIDTIDRNLHLMDLNHDTNIHKRRILNEDKQALVDQLQYYTDYLPKSGMEKLQTPNVSSEADSLLNLLQDKPLQFKQEKVAYKAPYEKAQKEAQLQNMDTVSYVGKMDPNQMKAEKYVGNFSTKQVDSPFGDTLKINPTETPLEFKTQIKTKPFKKTIEVPRSSVTKEGKFTDVPNNPKTETGGASIERDANGFPKKYEDAKALLDKAAAEFKAISPESFSQATYEKQLKALKKRFGIKDENTQPQPETSGTGSRMGITPGGAVHVNDISWVDSPKSLKQKVMDGELNAKTLWKKGVTHAVSDLKLFKDMMRTILKQDMGATLQTIRNGKDIAYEDNLFKGLKGVRLSISKAMKSAKEDYGPILKTLKANKISTRDFDEYASAVHFQDVLTKNHDKMVRAGEVDQRLQDIEQLRQGTNDKKIIQQLDDEEKQLLKEKTTLEPYILPKEATPDKIQRVLDRWANTPAMEQARQSFIQAQQKDLAMQVQSGLLSKSQMDAMIAAHPNYVYLGRNKEFDSPFGGNGNISKPSQHIVGRKNGSEENLKYTPLESAIRNRVLTYHNVTRNDAMRSIEKIAQANGGSEFFQKLDMNLATDTQKKYAVKFFKDGKQEFYEVPPVMKQAFDNLDSKNAEKLWTKVIQATSNVIRKGATYYNLDFIVKSPMRETNALVTSRTGMHPGHLVVGYMDSFFGKGIEKLGFKSYRHIYEQLGGHQAGYVTQDPQSIKAFIRAMKKGSLGNGLDIINPFHWISKVGGAVEHGPKLAEFRSAKGKGYSNLDAMHEAVDVIDYTDLGTTTRQLNKYVPFLGPMIRGTSRYFQAAKEAPAAWAAKNLMYVTAPTLAIYATRFAPWATDEQRSKINNMNEWQKNLFWAIPAPNGKSVWVIPKMHVGAQIFANPVERVLDQMYKQNPKSVKQLFKDTGKDTANILTPPSGIAGVQLLLDSSANYNRQMDMPIEDIKMQHTPDKTKHYNSYTSEVAKWLGKKSGQSPAKIDYVLKGLTAGTGRDVLDTMDNVLSKNGKRPSKVDTTLDILNPAKQLQYKDTSSPQTYTDLYNQQLKDGKGSDSQDLYKQMQELNKQVKSIRESKKLSSEEKKKKISSLRAKQRKIGDQAISSGILRNQ